MDSLPDAPWIVESWYTGGCPDETPYDRRGATDFLEGADSDYGWRILAWELNVDTESIDDDMAWQDAWNAMNDKTRRRLCDTFERMHFDESAELYNKYWRDWHGN